MMRLDSNEDRSRDIGLLVLRVIVGIVFIAHGYLKFKMGLEGTTGFMTKLGVPLASVAAPFSIIAEIGGGIALILGILTLPVGIALTIDMLGAITFARHWAELIGPKGYELELLLLSASVALAFAGPGGFSLAFAFGSGRGRHT
jgi:putative oxidoreductase